MTVTRDITRRTLLKNSSIVGSMMTIATVLPTQSAQAEASGSGFFHVFAFRWKPGTTAAQIEQARRDILAFQGVIPGLLQTHVGPNLSAKGKGYSFGGVMHFMDQASYDAYPHHPAHEALLTWLVSLIDAIELDLTA